MYKHKDNNDSLHFSLHDCRAEKMNFNDGTLSFEFSDGFWVVPHHPLNESENLVRTDHSRVDFPIIEKEICAISICVFKNNDNGETIREEWEPEDFINAVNAGDFQIEFIDEYTSYHSYLFKCWIWFDKEPYHYECEIILHSEKATYCWNNLRYDRVW